jgi:hypothetical protein
MTTTMNKHHQQTYDAIFQHPMPHGLHRRDVMSMLGGLAEVREESNGNFKMTRNGQTLVLHASLDKNITETDELMRIRRFLERSADPVREIPETGGHVLVVLDHRQARIYRTELHGAMPQRIVPFDPYGFGRSLHYVQDDSNGQRKPERQSFYEAIAQTLGKATSILLFGSGTGASSAMEQLLAELRRNHPAVAQCVVGSVALDTQHLTEDQLLAKAREFYGERTVSSER